MKESKIAVYVIVYACDALDTLTQDQNPLDELRQFGTAEILACEFMEGVAADVNTLALEKKGRMMVIEEAGKMAKKGKRK